MSTMGVVQVAWKVHIYKDVFYKFILIVFFHEIIYNQVKYTWPNNSRWRNKSIIIVIVLHADMLTEF